MQTIKLLCIVLASLLALVHATPAPPAKYRDYDIFIDNLENGVKFRIAELEEQLVKVTEEVAVMEQHVSVHKADKDSLLHQIDSLITLSKEGLAFVGQTARGDLKPKFGPFQAQLQMLSQEFVALLERVNAIKA